MASTDVVIVGGGVAGCTLGHLLERRSSNVTLLEKTAIGGLLRDIELASGYYCDSAPHLLFFDEETEPEVEALFSEFTTLTHHNFFAATYPRGSLRDPHHYPVSKENIDRWDDAGRIRAELEEVPGKTQSEYFEEYLLNQVGPTLYNRYYRNYTESHWGIDPERITGDWFDFKIKFHETERDFFGDGAYYPDDTYTDVLTEMVSDCEVVYDGATGLITDGDRIEGIQTASGEVVSGDTYVSTIDPTLLVADVEPSPRYRSMIVLGAHIVAERPFPTHVDWGYFPNHYAFTRITDYAFTPQNIPDGERLLTAEFPCFVGDDIWGRREEWFERYLVDFFETQGLEIGVIATEVRRVSRAYPLPVAEEIQKFERVNNVLTSYSNMLNLGRTSTYEYIWIKDIVAQAYEIADKIELTP